MRHVRTAVAAAPSNQVFAQHREADRLAGFQFFGLQNRIPVIPQSLGRPAAKFGATSWVLAIVWIGGVLRSPTGTAAACDMNWTS